MYNLTSWSCNPTDLHNSRFPLPTEELRKLLFFCFFRGFCMLSCFVFLGTAPIPEECLLLLFLLCFVVVCASSRGVCSPPSPKGGLLCFCAFSRGHVVVLIVLRVHCCRTREPSGTELYTLTAWADCLFWFDGVLFGYMTPTTHSHSPPLCIIVVAFEWPSMHIF